MIRGSKWMDQLTSRAGITDAARVALPRRLESVFYYVPLVIHRADESDEYVHQLRVSTRRFQAALSMTSLVLPAKQVALWKRVMRQLRRSAGEVRDFDVMLRRMTGTNDQQPFDQTTRETMVTWLHGQRQEQLRICLPQIQSVEEEFSHDRWRRLVAKVRWRGRSDEPLARDVFARELRRRAKSFSRGGLNVLESKLDIDDLSLLHRFRISGKRIRYAIELAGGVFDGRLRAMYEIITTIQSRLGRINDHASARDFFASHQAAPSTEDLHVAIDAIIHWESEALETEFADWAAWWNRERLELFCDQCQEVIGGKRWSFKKRA